MIKDYGKQLKRGWRPSVSPSKICLSPFAKPRLFSLVIASLATFYSWTLAEGVYQESTSQSPRLREAPSPDSYRPTVSSYEPLPELPESSVVFHAPETENKLRERGIHTAVSTPLAQQGETLAYAVDVAVSQSRTQRAMASRRDASQSGVQAAQTLRNPKISNTTAYIGLLNQPEMKSQVDISGAVASIGGSLPPDLAGAVGPILSNLPTQFQVSTPVLDKNSVASVTSVTPPLYLGGRVKALEESAVAMTQAIAAGEEVDLQRVKLETTEAFFLVLRLRSLLQVAIDATASAQSHLHDAVKMESVGILTKNVALAAQVALSEAQQAELQVRTALSIAESAYNRILWRPLDSPVNLVEEEMAPLGESVDSLISSALANRGEIRALDAERRALQAQERVARADIKPQVAAVGAYSYIENSHMTANSNATAAIGMTWTPCDGGTSRAREQAARHSAMAVARLREETEAGIKLQIRQAWLAQNEAYARLKLAQNTVDHAEENYRVTTRGFQEGVLNHTEALDAASNLTAAKSAFTNAKYDAILATERLKRATGCF